MDPTALFNQFTAYSKENPLVSAAFSLWGLGIITFFCRNVPTKIFAFLKRQFTTSLTFTNDQRGRMVESFSGFMDWFEVNQVKGLSRTLSLDGDFSDRGTTVAPGDGIHFFKYKGKLFWLQRFVIDKQTTHQLLSRVTITTLGRSRKPLTDLVDEFRYVPPTNKVGVYVYKERDSMWVRKADISKRDLKTVIIPQDLRSKLLHTIDQFKVSKEWYLERGIPYKLSFALHGLPGTGKTSLIKALSSHYGMNMCVLNLNQMSDNSFSDALSSTPYNSIIVLEDFDGTNATHARKGLATVVPSVQPETDLPPRTPADPGEGARLSDFSSLTLSGILNALDGLVSLEDKILFMTTNRLEILDPALVRKGRIDHTLHIAPMGDAEIREYIALMFPNYTPDPRAFASILGCELQDLYFAHRDDPEAFVVAIPRN